VNQAILLRYHEVALKGGNRSWFEKTLAQNACQLIKNHEVNEPSIQVKFERGRILLFTPWSHQTKNALEHCFGITSFSTIRNRHTAQSGMPETFRVLTRRSDKVLPETSVELDRYFGATMITSHPNLKVDLENPQFTLGIEIRAQQSYIWTDKFRAPGGLPVGTNGPLLTLLSGGLDSPVAAIQVMKRGASTSLIHFHGAPFVGENALQKVEDLARIIRRFSPDPIRLYVVPFGKIQEKIALSAKAKYRTLLYRRMMIRIACSVAEKNNLLSLVTGESIGQVASQTVENLAAIDRVSTLPILRPFIASDKEEIIEKAKNLGTYDTSIRPGLDCCTLFSDRHPALKAKSAELEKLESLFPMKELIQEGLENITSTLT